MDRFKLIEYIETLKNGELVYQFPGELLSVLGEPCEEQTSIHDEKKMLINVIQNAKYVRQVDKNFIEELDGYCDIADWSHEEDALVIADEDLLINLGVLKEVRKQLCIV